MYAPNILAEHEAYLSGNHWMIRNDFNTLAYQFSKNFRMSVPRARGIIRHYESIHITGNSFKMDFEIKEEDIIPAHRLYWMPETMENIEPLKIEPIPGTTKVIVTYPSRV
jgi:hypothetical protein